MTCELDDMGLADGAANSLQYLDGKMVGLITNSHLCYWVISNCVNHELV